MSSVCGDEVNERERERAVMHNELFDDNNGATDSYGIMSVK